MDRLEQGITYLSVDCFGYRTDNKLWPLFSTISMNFEKGEWGSKFPTLLKQLCDNSKVDISNLIQLKEELKIAYSKLSNLKIKNIYMDYENKDLKIKCKKEDLEDPLLNYFTNEKGKNLVEILLKAVDDAIELQVPIEIKNI